MKAILSRDNQPVVLISASAIFLGKYQVRYCLGRWKCSPSLCPVDRSPDMVIAWCLGRPSDWVGVGDHPAADRKKE